MHNGFNRKQTQGQVPLFIDNPTSVMQKAGMSIINAFQKLQVGGFIGITNHPELQSAAVQKTSAHSEPHDIRGKFATIDEISAHAITVTVMNIAYEEAIRKKRFSAEVLGTTTIKPEHVICGQAQNVLPITTLADVIPEGPPVEPI